MEPLKVVWTQEKPLPKNVEESMNKALKALVEWQCNPTEENFKIYETYRDQFASCDNRSK